MNCHWMEFYSTIQTLQSIQAPQTSSWALKWSFFITLVLHTNQTGHASKVAFFHYFFLMHFPNISFSLLTLPWKHCFIFLEIFLSSLTNTFLLSYLPPRINLKYLKIDLLQVVTPGENTFFMHCFVYKLFIIA